MKKLFRKRNALMSFALTLMGLSLFGPSVFATNPYGIEYSGGTPLSSENVNIDPDLIDDLQPLVQHSNNNSVIYEDITKWQTVYETSNGECIRSNHKYFGVSRNNTINRDSGLNYQIVGENYTLSVQFDRIVIEGYDSTLHDNEVIALLVNANNGSIATTTHAYYTDSACADMITNHVPIHTNDGGHIYFQVNLKLYKKDSTEPFAPSGLYFGMTDVDAAQSYKILNADNLLSSSNMYARSADAIQPQDSALRNMYVTSDHYIYSQYNPNAFNIPSGADIFVSVKPEAQEDGLDVVFGFTGGAASGIQYYAEQYTVTYDSDINGRITGISEEKIVAESNPTGSTETPNTGYTFSHWVADKDVTLTNGDTITAGDPITSDQIQTVVVTGDLTFTAINEINTYTVTYLSDSNGNITGIATETVSYGSNPAGTTEEPNPGYSLSHWIADEDVTLTNGDTITAGDPITNNQIELIVVEKDIKLTAINEINTYTVNYAADSNGSITGITTETVSFESNPTGTTKQANEGYQFTNWTADKDVTLKNGTTITAGETIPESDIPNVVVTEDLTFTAHFDPIPVVEYTISYTATEGGQITGTSTETVSSDGNPTGTTEESNSGYAFVYWIADKDVTLTNGDTIPAGSPITSDQIPLIIVDKDIRLTAVYEKIITIPDTGAITKENEGAQSIAISISTIIAVVSAFTLGFLPKILNKK